ncbi:MAG: hypothetical protein LBQ23_03040 [Puniceicoccales bacterium]|nr:hypothetical protein [Puniceicoccales bacterium]
MGFKVLPKSNEHEHEKAKEITKNIQSEDLVKFGFISEFIDRSPAISVLNELMEEDLCDILLNTKNALTKQYEKLLVLDGVCLIIANDVIPGIVK